MTLQPDTSPHKRPLSLFLGVLFALLTGGLALLLGGMGLMGKGGTSDVSLALPNFVTGLASLVGAAGYLALRRWAVPVYLVAVLAHWGSHLQLLLTHRAAGRVSVGGTLFLLAVPTLALLVLLNMERHRRQRLLS